MRARGRTDRNQAEVVQALRRAGMTVQPLSAVGGGVPDLLVGWRDRNYLVEVKDGAKTAGNRPLTAAQREWHATWAGRVFVAESVDDAITQIVAEVGRG